MVKFPIRISIDNDIAFCIPIFHIGGAHDEVPFLLDSFSSDS